MVQMETAVFQRIAMERREKVVKLLVEILRQTARFGTFSDEYLRATAQRVYAEKIE